MVHDVGLHGPLAQVALLGVRGDHVAHLIGQVEPLRRGNAGEGMAQVLARAPHHGLAPVAQIVLEELAHIDEDRPGVTVVGGMASGGSAPGQNRLVLGNRLFDEGAVAVLLGSGLILFIEYVSFLERRGDGEGGDDESSQEDV